MDALNDEIRSNSTIRELKQLKEYVIDCAKNFKSNDATFELSTLPKVSEKLTGYMQDYVDCVKKIESYQKSFLKVNEEIDKLDDIDNDANNEDDQEETEKYIDPDIYSKLFDETANSEYVNSATSDRVALSELEKIVRPNEEEIQFESPSTRQIPKDPMTKKDIRIAVKSTKCNHIYDQDGIEEYFKLKEQGPKGTKICCPQAGCTNKNMTRKELILDEETNRIIQSLST